MHKRIEKRNKTIKPSSPKKIAPSPSTNEEINSDLQSVNVESTICKSQYSKRPKTVASFKTYNWQQKQQAWSPQRSAQQVKKNMVKAPAPKLDQPPRVYNYVPNVSTQRNPKVSLLVRSMQQKLVECPVCKRKFGIKAADRHIQFCKSHQKKMKEKMLLEEGKILLSDKNSSMDGS